MSTNINFNLLRHFITQKVGNTLDAREAKHLGVENEYIESLDENEIEISIDEIIDSQGDLYEQFAVMYVTEQESQKSSKDKEEEEAELLKVSNKAGAGI